MRGKVLIFGTVAGPRQQLSGLVKAKSQNACGIIRFAYGYVALSTVKHILSQFTPGLFSLKVIAKCGVHVVFRGATPAPV
jgi:hypothetical protein